ncbi:MAG: polyprenyl diphosphate synthase [Candidatus Pacebacteria bacterium]|nr:polyprenyl diphosphate synthase [Candidatus Paceibacterota bacterium]
MEKLEKLPKHIAIIPDGNRRWAKKRMMSPWLGHKKGTESLESLGEVAVEMKIPYLSFWGSSKDNLIKRPKEEVDFLLKLFKEEFLKLSESEKIHKNEMKINILGSWQEQFPEDVKCSMEKAMKNTENYDKYFFNFFIAYSGTDDMVDAIKKISELKLKNPEIEIDRKIIKGNMVAKDLPPVDLLIRTGGEPHNSDGFMMWDVANSQFVFLEKLWPDFTAEDLKEATVEYSKRERRLGK